MKENEFKEWLENTETINKASSVNNRIANCKTIEDKGYILDEYYNNNKEKELLDIFSYSTEDQRNNKPSIHNIPINGNIRTVTATYKSAIKLYFEFLDGLTEITEVVINKTLLQSKLIDFIESFGYQEGYHKKVILLQNDLLNDLKNNFPNFEWVTEKRVSEKYKDKIDIYGTINNYAYRVLYQ